nr:MAG TPA: hypothetical protein [Caudoviricetes sp.]
MVGTPLQYCTTIFLITSDKLGFIFRKNQNSKVTASQWLECHSLVGLRIVGRVIRRSNGKPLEPSDLVGFVQICEV